MIELKDSIPMMQSDDYKERFKAEALQVAIRLDKLNSMLEKWDGGTLDFEPSCPYWLLSTQRNAMEIYLETLVQRAEIEGIELLYKESTH